MRSTCCSRASCVFRRIVSIFFRLTWSLQLEISEAEAAIPLCPQGRSCPSITWTSQNKWLGSSGWRPSGQFGSRVCYDGEGRCLTYEGGSNKHTQTNWKQDRWQSGIHSTWYYVIFITFSVFISMSLGTNWLNGSRQFRKINHLEVNSLLKVQRYGNGHTWL